MAKLVEIPQDIIDNVIAEVGDDTHLLKQCSLVSPSFLFPSRRKLFSRIFLTSDQTCQGILQVLVQNPVIQSFVRTITLTEYESMPIVGSTGLQWMNGPSLLAILRLPFRCLECFSITVCRDEWDWISWDWDAFSSELKDALSNIVHSSTLKTLSLNGIARVPNSFWLHIVHLTTLELNSLSPKDFDDKKKSSSLTQAASQGVAPMASHTAIDQCVWHFNSSKDLAPVYGMILPSSAYFSLIQDGEDFTQSIFLPFMCRLRFFKIYASLGSEYMNKYPILTLLMGSLCISLTSPATLEHLEFNIRLRGSIFDSDFDSFYENLRDADVWSHLDSITTYPTGSRLQRVDINIDYSFRYDDDEEEPDKDKIEKAVLDGLPLLHTKCILFVEAVLGE